MLDLNLSLDIKIIITHNLNGVKGGKYEKTNSWKKYARRFSAKVCLTKR